MGRTIDEQWVETRIKMREFGQLLTKKDLPEGVYMYSALGRVEQRLNNTLSQVWLELADAESIVNAIGADKADS